MSPHPDGYFCQNAPPWRAERRWPGAGRLVELDELCRRTAVTAAIDAGIFAPLTLFVNVEPAALRAPALDELVALAATAPRPLDVVLEITERALATDPAGLLATVRRLRSAGWRIALDDVGTDDLSLTFMSLLRPDVIKIDMGIVQRRPNAAAAVIMNAVNAHSERTGCILLAEGIEDDVHVDAALALGAGLGQGWKFGRPAPTVRPASLSAIALPDHQSALPHGTPFDALPASIALRVSSKPLLLQVSHHLERQAAMLDGSGLAIGTFQRAEHFTPASARRYAELARHLGFVAALGAGLSADPVAGVRGAALDDVDPLNLEWDIVVLSPHFAAALIARDLGDDGPDRNRRFEFALTYDRDLVIAAAASLISRILPS